MKKNRIFSIFLSVALCASGQLFCSEASYFGNNSIGRSLQYARKVSSVLMTDFAATASKYLPSRRTMLGALSAAAVAGLVYCGYKTYYAGPEQPAEPEKVETTESGKAETIESEIPKVVAEQLEVPGEVVPESSKEPEQIVATAGVEKLSLPVSEWQAKINEYRKQNSALKEPNLDNILHKNNSVNIAVFVRQYIISQIRIKNAARRGSSVSESNQEQDKQAIATFTVFLCPVIEKNKEVLQGADNKWHDVISAAVNADIERLLNEENCAKALQFFITKACVQGNEQQDKGIVQALQQIINAHKEPLEIQQ